MKSFPKKYMKIWILSIFLLLSLCACNPKPSSLSPHPTRHGRSALLNIHHPANQKIILLLPMQGRYAGPAQAIRNGFLAAYDLDKKNRNIESQVTILDTSGKSTLELYQKAISEGAHAIVGPLTKEDVQLIAQLPEHPVPTLALNVIETPGFRAPPQFYQFGLSPLDEAKTIAESAYQQGHRQAIILTPNTPWGKTVNQALSHQWTAVGGKVSDQLAFSSSMQQLSSEIPKLFHLSDSTSSPSQPTQNALPVNYRQDVDVILLAAPSHSARAILSLLKYHYLQKIPVYATSSVYSGHVNAQDQELNQIYFADIPWLNTPQLPTTLSLIQHHSQNLWPQNYRQYPRFYALGVDAYHLIANAPGASRGGTGLLTIDRENKIHRQLTLFQMRNETPVAIDR